ncbi:MAG: DUF929 domain-containing protein [Candidatus Thermoplasmatota archaeon]|nr:DUF929 domain-containing protein [Candidatus Thermoplasmatota archaeon]
MTNKEYKRRKYSKKAENEQKISTIKKKENYKKIISIVVVVAVIASVGGLFGLHIIKFPSLNPGSSFTAPSVTPWGSGEQISDSNFGSNVHIYYISWYGCPFGATDSWAFYIALNQYLNTNLSARGWVTLHQSVSGDVDGNTPGLLFSSFSYKNVVFTPVYVYNQTMKGYASNNTSINSAALVSVGLNEINSSVPASVSSLEYKYLYVLPVSGYSMSSFLHFKLPHVNTNIIITGPNGAWLFNGPIYNPSILRQNSTTAFSPTYVMNNLSTIPSSAVSSVLSAIKQVS